MANARLLPSGAYQTRATKVISGKKVTKCFTVHPKDCQGNTKKAKKLSEHLASEWQLAADEVACSGMNIRQALDSYIHDRSKVLSPSTITNYKNLVPFYEPLFDLSVDDIKTADIQSLINEWSVSVTAKTIKNRTSLLLSALDYAECDKKFRLRYPKSIAKQILSPDLEDVQMLLQNSPEDFKPVLYLAAIGGLRRGELAALKQKDISRDMRTIYVHADIVLDGNKWIYKPFPKNAQAGSLVLSKFIIDMLPYSEDPEAFVFGMNPTQISRRYERLCKKLGFQYNLHSLRHFAASFRSDLGIPRKYIEEVGRWESGSKILERVYDNGLESSRKKYIQITNHFVEKNLNFESKAQ